MFHIRSLSLLAVCFFVSLSTQASPALQGELQTKSDEFRRLLYSWHLMPDGMLAYKNRFSAYQDGSVAEGRYQWQADTPSWLGLWVSSACVRAKVLTDPIKKAEALADIDRGLLGLENIMNVTGIQGLMARSFRPYPNVHPDEGGRTDYYQGQGPGFEHFRYRGDVSQDQYANGIIPVAWDCQDFFPERVKNLITDTADHLLKNDYQLIEANGEVTTFGDLKPFALNPIGKLTGYAIMSLAHHFAPENKKYKKEVKRWMVWVLLTSKMTNVRIFHLQNYSNDLMTFSLLRALLPLHKKLGKKWAVAQLRSMVRILKRRTLPFKQAYYHLSVCYLDRKLCDEQMLAEARDQLRRFPQDKRNIYNREALDQFEVYKGPVRKNKKEAVEIVPIEIRPIDTVFWKASPYKLHYPEKDNLDWTASGVDYIAAHDLLLAIEARTKSSP